MSLKSTFIKWTQWEHWPTFMFYIPIIPYYLFRAIKEKCLTFYLLTNPAIKYSGDGTESKYKTICLVPEKYRPNSILINELESLEKINSKIKEAKLNYPIIIKPDIGFRGFLVKKIDNVEDLTNYIQKNNSIKLIIQEYLNYKNECGILYYRYPNEKKGKITSITLKKFLSVVGNGKNSLIELIQSDARAFLYLDLLKNIHGENLITIPKDKEEVILTVIGNHSKGTQFLNGNHLISKQLETTFDKLNKQIKGCYFGRLDIKYNDFKSLENGEDFKVIEINGIIAEPTHVYDASAKGASYFKALKAIKNNWKVIADISIINKKELNLKYPKTITYIKNMKFLRVYSWKLKRLNKLN